MNEFELLNLTEQNGPLTNEQVTAVKGLGFLRDKRFPDVFNARVITRNGKITVTESRAIADAAEKYGSGEVAFTSRLTVEVQGIPYKNIPAFINFLKEYGLETGGTGPKVRPIVSCKGTTCHFGLIDTYSLSRKIHDRFYTGWHNTLLPHKFKIAVGGCPNNCVKPDINDLGVIGQCIFKIDPSLCKGCTSCIKACPMGALNLEDGILTVDKTLCNNCGRCIGKCHFNVFTKESEGYKVFIGGRWGKKVARGQALSKIFTTEDEVLQVIEKALTLFRDEGIKGERFNDTVERLGFDYVEEKLI